MALVSLVAALLGTSLSNPADTICRPYVGHQVTTRTFEEVRSSLPVVPAKGKYESTADYEKRLATALAPVGPVIIRQSLPYRGLDYDADRGQLKIHQTAFGAGETNFGNLLGSGGMTSRADNFSGVIGLMVGVSETMTDTYDAANGFGAHFTVTRTSRSVDAVWERPGDIRQSMFIDAKPFGPIAQFNVSSSVAQDLIEAGSSAVLIVPKAPYLTAAKSVVEPTFSSPRERDDRITVIVADIQCSFLLDSKGMVFAAFAVR